MKSSASLHKEGESKIKIKLIDEKNLSSEYVLIIKLICKKKDEPLSQDYMYKFDDNAPIAYIDHIDMIGRVYIKFNNTMVPKHAISRDDLYSNSSRPLEVESYLG